MLKFIIKSFFVITLFNKLIIEVIGLDFITTYFDEIICLFFAFFIIFNNKVSRTFLTLILVFVIVNFISVFLYEFPFESKRFLLDTFLFLKPIIVFMALLNVNSNVFKECFPFFLILSRTYIFLSILCLPLNYFTDIFELSDLPVLRFGLKSYSFVAHNAGEFLNLVLVTGIISTLGKNKWHNKLFALSCIILLLTTLRFKGFVIAFAYLLFQNRLIIKSSYNFFRKKIISRKLFTFRTLITISPLVILLLIPGFSQFSNYFLSDNLGPRLVLTLQGYNLFIENFPFGTGPGLFGSATASLYYSPIYTELGWNDNWGLGENPDVNFLNDNFWPMILAQYGFIGTIIVILIYKKFIYEYFSFSSQESFIYALLSLFSLLISSIGSAIFIGYLGMFYIINRFIIHNAANK